MRRFLYWNSKTNAELFPSWCCKVANLPRRCSLVGSVRKVPVWCNSTMGSNHAAANEFGKILAVPSGNSPDINKRGLGK